MLGAAGKEHRTPLLPYERQLIDEIGCSEDEYRRFVEAARQRALVRPAGYEHVPEVVADAITIAVISLVVGVLSTAASLLMAPKPPNVEEQQQKQITNQDRGGKTGPSRFNSTYGYETLADVATYGSPVPIAFGQYQEYDPASIETYTGGIIVTPKLVWSRLFSWGTQQSYKALYVVGQRELFPGALSGIFLGNTALDNVYESSFAVYWARGDEDSSRIKGKHLIYGTRATPDSGDPETDDDVFSCPTSEGLNDDGYSQAYTPAANNQFGLSSPIVNGTDFRPNYEVISSPTSSTGDAKSFAARKRNKVSHSGRSQLGVGRAYGRRMGIVDHNGYTPSKREQVVVAKGDRVTFKIAAGQLRADMWGENVSVDDIINEQEAERIAADDALRVGEEFLIGKSTWRVIGRTQEIWTVDTEVDVVLECMEVFGNGTIGLVPSSMISTDVLNDGTTLNDGNHIQANFYPLQKFNFGLVRHLRRTDITDIGIRSQVWAKFNGLCNFNNVPTSDGLFDLDQADVSLSVGQMALYFTRYSWFTVLVRPAGGTDDTGQDSDAGWVGIQEEFCIRGDKPVDQFNFLRIKNPMRGMFEFRLVPLSGTYVTRKPSGSYGWELDATATGELKQNYPTPYGTFELYARGRTVGIEATEFSPFMKSTEGVEPGQGTWTREERLSAVELYAYNTNSNGRAHGYRYEIFGRAQNEATGTLKTVRVRIGTPGMFSTKYIDVDMTSTVYDLGRPDAAGQTKVWTPPTLVVAGHSSLDRFDNGDLLDHNVTITSFNPYRFLDLPNEIAATYRATKSYVDIWQPPNPERETRTFEWDTQIMEVSHYNDKITRSCDSGPEHSIAYVTEMVAQDDYVAPDYHGCTMFGLSLKSNRNFTRMDQPRAWIADGVRVNRLIDGAYGPSNNLTDLIVYLLTSTEAGLGEYVSPELIDMDQMRKTAQFLETNRLYFDGVIEDRINLRSWLTEIAPMFLCNFAIRDGQFSLIPAVPTDDAGNILGVKVPIAAMFTEGNIIEDSFNLEYLDTDQRQPIQAVAQFRRGYKNQLFREHTRLVRFKGDSDAAIETFDMLQYCTRQGQASIALRHLLAVRKYTDHVVTFRTTPEQISLAPGDYIKLFTQASPYSSATNGVVRADGTVVTTTPLEGNNVPVVYWDGTEETLKTATLTVVDGRATDPALYGAVFSVSITSVKGTVYLVESLELTEEGLVEIRASHFPVDDQGYSLIAKTTMDMTEFDFL